MTRGHMDARGLRGLGSIGKRALGDPGRCMAAALAPSLMVWSVAVAFAAAGVLPVGSGRWPRTVRAAGVLPATTVPVALPATTVPVALAIALAQPHR